MHYQNQNNQRTNSGCKVVHFYFAILCIKVLQNTEDKCITEKISILGARSSILVNRNLSIYMHNETFDQDKRKEDMLHEMYNNIFEFDPEIFHITKEDIEDFNKQKSIVRENETLNKLLNQLGKNFLPRLNADPKLNESLMMYRALTESDEA